MNNSEQKKEAPVAPGTSSSPLDQHLDTFQFHTNALRIVSQDGQPWFVLADICKVLGISNPSMVADRIDEDEKNTLSLAEGINKGNPNITIVNESGMYSVILRSDKPQAKPFRKWITSEVLPTLRRTGTYTIPTQTHLPLPCPTNPAVDLGKVGEIIKAAAQFAKDFKPRRREEWMRNTAIHAYRAIHGADISDLLPMPFIGSSAPAACSGQCIQEPDKVAVGNCSPTATPATPEAPPLRSLGLDDVLIVGKKTWWSMLKLQHETGLSQYEILCCLYEHGVCDYDTKTDALTPWFVHNNSYWVKKHGRIYWNLDLVEIIKHRKYYLEREWPKKWIARQLAAVNKRAKTIRNINVDGGVA